MGACCAPWLTEEGVEVCSSLLAAGPELEALVKHWAARMVCAHFIVTLWPFVR